MEEDLEGHCAGENGCAPFPIDNIMIHERVEKEFNKALYGSLGVYIRKIKDFFKRVYNI